MLEVGKMDKRKDLSIFDKSQIVAWGYVRAQAAAVVEYSRSAVSIKSGSRKEQWWTSDSAMSGQGSAMQMGSKVRSNRRAAVAQIAKKVDAHPDIKVSEHRDLTVRCIWGCMAAENT